MITKNKRLITKESLAILFILLSACIFVATPCYAYLAYCDDAQGGFLQGLWHGIISFLKLPLSVLAPQYLHVYNSNNNGFMYNAAFFVLAIIELELTLPLLIIAWIIRIIFWVIVFVVAMVSGLLLH